MKHGTKDERILIEICFEILFIVSLRYYYKSILMSRFCFFLFLSCTLTAYSQIGGNGVYPFLNLSNSARVASLGGKAISIDDNDLNIAALNPSLLKSSMHNNLVINYVDYISDINFGYAGYAFKYDQKNTFAVGVQYLNYGILERADPTGVLGGRFYASENALNLMYSHCLDSNFSLGVNFKPVYSNLESYHSFGFGTDLAASYTSKDHLLTASMLLRNMGTQITRYSSESGYERLPFEIIAGFSKKFAHAPFRIIVTAQQLQKFKLNYLDTSKVELDKFGQIIGPSKLSDFGDNLMRHIIIAVEFTPFKSLYLRAGYNYQRRKEMQLPDNIGAVGFSWGFGIRISKIHISYGRSSQFLGFATNSISVAANLSEFYSRK